MAKKAKKTAKKSAKKTVKKLARKVAKTVAPIPTDSPQLAPYFSVSNANDAIAFYTQVLGAKVKSLMKGPDGKVAHCSLKVGNSTLMLSEPFGPGAQVQSGRSSGVMLYVKDARAVFEKAVSLGAKTLTPVTDMFWGDRWGMFEDPFGNVWQIATHIEDVKPAEMAKRAAAAMPPPPPPSEVSASTSVTAQA